MTNPIDHPQQTKPPRPDSHFSRIDLSNWQSAVAKLTTSPAYKDAPDSARSLGRKFLDFGDKLVAAAATAAQRSMQGGAAYTDNTVRQAELALGLAQAKIAHDEEAVLKIEQEVSAFGKLDPQWLECVAEYISHYALTKHGNVPYQRWTDINQFVAAGLPSKCRIGFIGDWGTNDARAQAVLERLASKEIDILIHLGDIYYSCTAGEASSFFTNMQAALGPYDASTQRFGTRQVRVFSLCGNHDMYSGGSAYYGLIHRLGQEASFFCFRNADWQLLAGDTGYEDFKPLEQGGGVIAMQDFESENPSYSEVTWHRKRLEEAKARSIRTIFMTHHQPFTYNGLIAKNMGVNTRLLGQMQPFADCIDVWMWGHEHNQVIYKPYGGIERGRCVGASAIPVYEDDRMYDRNSKIEGDMGELLLGEKVQLGIEQKSRRYCLGYAVIAIDGKAGRETYYELNTETGVERLLFDKTI